MHSTTSNGLDLLNAKVFCLSQPCEEGVLNKIDKQTKTFSQFKVNCRYL